MQEHTLMQVEIKSDFMKTSVERCVFYLKEKH